MPTILELIQSEKQAQDEEEARPAVADVESSRSFILEMKPDPAQNISLEMCVLRVEEFDKMFRIDLIDRELESEGEELLKTFDSLDQARRSKFIFQLTIWKNRKKELNRLEYRRGFSYRFEKVHSLRLLYGNPTGSMQIRQQLRAEPIPVADEGGDGHAIQSSTRGCATSSPPSSSNCISTPRREGRSLTADRIAAGAADAVVTPVAKVAGKRKAVKDDGDVTAPRKIRRSNSKQLCFDSPEKATERS